MRKPPEIAALPDTLPLLVLPALMLAAAWCDALRYTIPNWISLALAGLFAPAALLSGMDPVQIGLGYLVGLGALAAGIALWAPGFIGGGDAKLIAAGAVWFGWPAVVSFAVWVGLAGGVLVLVLLLARRAAPLLPVTRRVTEDSLFARGKPVPYALAIAAGAFIALPAAPIAAV